MGGSLQMLAAAAPSCVTRHALLVFYITATSRTEIELTSPASHMAALSNVHKRELLFLKYCDFISPMRITLAHHVFLKGCVFAVVA